MNYDINFNAPNNQLSFESLLGYFWSPYSNISVGVVGYGFDYDQSPCLGEADSTKCKYKWLRTHA